MVHSVLLAACLAAAPATIQPAGLRVASQLGDTSAAVQADRFGQLRFARGQLGYLANSPAAAKQFVQNRAAAFGLRADEELSLLVDERDLLGQRHVRLTRFINGIPVEFDQVRLHANAAGIVTTIEAELSPLKDFVYRAPTVPPLKAMQIAEGGFKGKLLEPTRAELVVLGQTFEGVSAPHLAYRVHVAFPAKPGRVPVIEDAYVDAHSGVILAHASRVYTDGTDGTESLPTLQGGNQDVHIASFSDGVALEDVSLMPSGPQIYSIDASQNGAIYTAADTSSGFADGESIDGEPGSVAYNVRTAVDFFHNQFGWDHWDFSTTPASGGGKLAGIAHEGQNLANAYFVPQAANGTVFGTMHYGDGDGTTITNTAKCLDVSGHELGHGVVAGTAALVYHNQSGALNEHFADVFGWMLKNISGDDRVDQIGDQCVGSFFQNATSKALRDMCDPGATATPQPGDMQHYEQDPDTDDGDHGGVHTNSGIPNHAACMFRNNYGSAGSGQGFGKLGAIWFTALHSHLGPTSSFQDMVNATGAACTDLNGSTTSADDCNNLVNAWAAVGLATPTSGSGGSCPANSTQQGSGCVCNSGYQPSSDGTSCDAIQQPASCPDHAHADASSGQCYCDDGYDVSEDGSSCEPINTGGCGANSHEEAGSCACDTCYVYGSDPDHPGSEQGACVLQSGCDPTCTDPGADPSNGCQCLDGLSKDANGKCTVAAGGCGHETFAGRCDGSTLIYCYQDQVLVYDCTTDPYQDGVSTACGPDTDNGGFNCVAPVSNCGSVPVTGACNGNTGEYCSDGTKQSADCGSAGCLHFTYEGYDYDYCNPCDVGQVPGAGDLALPDGGYNCVASSGGTNGGSTGGSGGSTGGSGGTSGSSGSTGGGDDLSGCSSGGNGTELGLLLGALVITLARRKK